MRPAICADFNDNLGVIHILDTMPERRREDEMNLEDILASWQRAKLRYAGMRLDAACTLEYEYRGRQFGHPSTYAFVRFDCTPSDTLTFESQPQWPASLAPDYCRLLEDAMRAAIVDVLVAADSPHVGCAIVCTSIKWDDVASSEKSLYWATKAAMTSLCEQQKWSFLKKA